jgi:hypothetical protein
LLDAAGEVEGGHERLLAAEKAAGHLVDGHDRGHGDAALDRFDNFVVVLNVELVPSLDQLNAGAEAFGFADLGSSADAKGLGLITGGDGAGGVGHNRDHGNRPIAQLGAEFLLDRGEIRIEVEKEPANTRLRGSGRVEGNGHWVIFAFLSPHFKSQREIASGHPAAKIFREFLPRGVLKKALTLVDSR